jgi:hypothetical protein
MGACDNSTKPDVSCSWDFLYAMGRKSDELDTNLLLMGIELRKLSGLVLENAELALSRREAWYRYANITSIFLFLAGWSFGLVGSVHHGRGIPETEG